MASVLAPMLAIATVTLAQPALAQKTPRVEIDVPAQTLSEALIQFGHQAGVQVAFVPDAALDRRSSALRGRYTVEDALRTMLAGSGLSARLSSTGTWIVERPRSPQVAQTSPSSVAAPRDETPDVTITGSRIRRYELDSATPTLIVDATNFEQNSNIGVEATLNRLPQFQPAETQYITTSVISNAITSPGIASLDLRGLGSNRSLVLIDGRRAQPTNATLTVDVNSIPAAALESVEVTSGGASSAYGADAIAGVVNFKLKRHFQGVALDVQSGITERGDGSETRISALLGSDLADGRGNVMFGAERARRVAVQQRDRRFYTDGWADPGTTTGGDLTNVSSYVPTGGNLPTQAAVNAVFAGYNGVSNASAFFVNPDGTLFKNTLVGGDPTSSAIRYTGPMDGIKRTTQGLLVQPERTLNLSTPLDRYSLFGRGDFAFSEQLSLFLQGNFSSSEVVTVANPGAATTATFNTPVPRDAAHPVPAELAAILDSRPQADAPFQLDRYLDFAGPRRIRTQNVVYQLLAGLQGELPWSDWTWEAYVSHGETNMLNYFTDGWVSRERLRRVVAAPNYGKDLTLTSSGSYTSHCTTGLPIFEYFTPSQDCIDAITVRLKNITQLTQDIVEANLQGRLASLPAGELRGAFGVSTRRNSVSFDPDVINDTESVLEAPVGIFATADTAGEIRVHEAYAELLVPLAKDQPLLKELNLELGGRFSDYATAGGSWTYKSLANWKVNDFVSFRGGYQFANRAPNVAEVYLGVTQQVVPFPERDPCTSTTAAAYGNIASNPDRARVQALCSAIIGTGTSLFDIDPSHYVGPNGPNFPFEREARTGNLELKPEKAGTVTLGAVIALPFENPLLNRVTATIDYYRISIHDTIAPLAATTIYRSCFNSDGVSNPTYSLDDPNGYCRLIVRDPMTGQRLQVNAQMANLGTTRTSGIDLQLDWRATLEDMGLEWPGSLAASVSANYLIDFSAQANPHSPREQYRGAFRQIATSGVQSGQFDYRTYTSLRYEHRTWTTGIFWQHMPSIHSTTYVIDPDTAVQGADSYDLFSLVATWQTNRIVAFRAGIDNLFDRQPEVVGREPGVTNAGGLTVPSFYDPIGRRYYVGVQLNF